MILFLNFAPIEFMGGAEKWMLTTAKKMSEKEKTLLVSVDPSISNIYGKLVLKREFSSRVERIDVPSKKITKHNLIPFTKGWKDVAGQFKEARIIYSRYELQELLIIFYFAGFAGLKKTILGVHSPLKYETPISFMDKFHNFVYEILNKNILTKVKKIHVLNVRDKNLLSDNLRLKNVVYIPNGIPEAKEVNARKNYQTLNVLFVGELSERKGVDILIDIAKKLPDHFYLTIAGDGPMASSIGKVAKKKKNVNYLGYLEKDKLSDIYEKNDVLLLPSRAESMPLTVLEALSHGLFIIDSDNITLGLGEDIEYSVKRFEADDYIAVLELINKTGDIPKRKIVSFFKNNFLDVKINRQLQSQIFNI